MLPTKAPVERLPPRHESEAKRNGVNPYGAPTKKHLCHLMKVFFNANLRRDSNGWGSVTKSRCSRRVADKGSGGAFATPA